MTSRQALGSALFAVGFVASYALQRLAAAWVGEMEASAVLASTHTPYFWRIAVAALHGVVLGLVAALATDDVGAGWWLARFPWLVLAVVLPAAVAMAVVP